MWIATAIHHVVKCCAMNPVEPSWHLFAFVKRIEFVTAWKAISIVFTGAFGILGLATEFKDKHHNITKWGRISLIGIVVSTIFGVAAQLKESADDAAKARTTSEKTLQLVKNSDDTLSNIQKLLLPTIENPHIETVFTLSCKTNRVDCKKVGSFSELKDPWEVTISFFAERSNADAYTSGNDVKPDLIYNVELDCTAIKTDDGLGMVCHPQSSEPSVTNNGKIRDEIDMHHATCLVEIDSMKDSNKFLDDPGGAQVMDLSVSMAIKNGITYTMKESSEVKASGGFVYVASF